MERLRLGSFSKGDHLARRSMSHVMTSSSAAAGSGGGGGGGGATGPSGALGGGPAGGPAPPLPPLVADTLTTIEAVQAAAQAPRCVIVQRDERGYGLTVSGDNPVYVQEVRPGGAAARAGVQVGDQIQKVNGTLVTSYNHQEVVQLIRSGQYVALTLIGPSPDHQHQHPAGGGGAASSLQQQQSTRSSNFPSLSRGTSFILVQGSLTPHQTRSTAGQRRDDARDRITGPQPVDADVMAQCNNTTLQTIQKMLSESMRQRQQLLAKLNDLGGSGDVAGSERLRVDLENVQRTIERLEKQMAQMRRPAQGGSKGPVTPTGPAGGGGAVAASATTTTTPPPSGLPSREATPDSTKQAPRRAKSSGASTGARCIMTSSASMENIPLSPLQGAPAPLPGSSPFSAAVPGGHSLCTPPRGGAHAGLLGNHQRQRSSPDSLIYRSPSEEGSTLGSWNPAGCSAAALAAATAAGGGGGGGGGSSSGAGAAMTGSPSQLDLVKSPLGESADVGGAPNEAFEYDDDDSSPLLQSNSSKPMANRPLPPLPLSSSSIGGGGGDPMDGRAPFEHQDSTESESGINLFAPDQSGFAALDDGGALPPGLGESLLKGWKVLRQPVTVAMFLHYLLSNKMNPAPLLFYVIVEQYKSGKQHEMSKWAYEITSTFLAPYAPLCIDPTLDDDVLQSIDAHMRKLDEGENLTELELRDIFVGARTAATVHLKPQLEEFQRDVESKSCDYHQSVADADNQGDNIKNWESILLNLCKTMFPLQDQVDSLPNQNSAMLSAIATVLRLTVVKSEFGLKALEHIPTFVSKEKPRLKLFSARPKKPLVMSVLGHNFQGQHYNRVTHCSVCQDILWGVGDQGLQCSNCEMNIHKQCFKNVDENCVGDGPKGKRASRRPTTGSLFRKDDNDSATELDKLSGGSGGSPLSASRAPVGRSESFRQRRESRNALRKRSDPNIPRSKSDVDADDKPRMDKAAHSDSDMDCNDELPKWEDLVGFETVRQLKPKEKKRQDVLNELFHTERIHVRKLKILNSVYYEPLTKILDQGLLDRLFPNLQELLQIHSELNQKLKFKRKQERVIGNVGPLMLEFFAANGGARLEQAITTFCKYQQAALDELKVKQKKDPKLQQFLVEASMKKECSKLHLKEIIATSYQRLTKYPLLLDQVLKYTQPGEEYDQINEAREHSKVILAKVNRTIGEIANQNRVRDVERNLEVIQPKDKEACDDRFVDERRTDEGGGSKKKSTGQKIEVHPLFLEPTLSKHKLIYEGILEWKLTQQKTIDITAMLFDDFLLLLQKQDEKYHLRYHQIQITEDKKAVYPPIIDFKGEEHGIHIRDKAGNKLGFFLLIKKNWMYEFVAHSVSDKNKWLEKIRNLKKYVQEEIEAPPVTTPVAAPAAPPAAEDRKETPDGKVLLQFNEVTVKPPVTDQLETAQPVATLATQLQRKDEQIRRLINEKYAIITQMLGLPDVQALTEKADEAETAKDSLGLLVNVIECTRVLQILINEALKEPPMSGGDVGVKDGGPTSCAHVHQHHQPSIPAHKAIEICHRLNASCMALSQAVGLFDQKRVFSTPPTMVPVPAVSEPKPTPDQRAMNESTTLTQPAQQHAAPAIDNNSSSSGNNNNNINNNVTSLNNDPLYANVSPNNNNLTTEPTGDSNNNESNDNNNEHHPHHHQHQYTDVLIPMGGGSPTGGAD